MVDKKKLVTEILLHQRDADKALTAAECEALGFGVVDKVDWGYVKEAAGELAARLLLEPA